MEVVCTQAQERGRWWQDLEGAAAAQSPGLESVLASPVSDPRPFLLAAPSRGGFCLFMVRHSHSTVLPFLVSLKCWDFSPGLYIIY